MRSIEQLRMLKVSIARLNETYFKRKSTRLAATIVPWNFNRRTLLTKNKIKLKNLRRNGQMRVTEFFCTLYRIWCCRRWLWRIYEEYEGIDCGDDSYDY